MASDEDYQAFLDKANQEVSGSSSSKKASTSQSVGTQAVDTEVPEALEKVEEYYVSDADEPFEPVSLKYAGSKLPTEDEFGGLLRTKHSITTIKQADFDPQGQYSKVVEAVKSAGGGDLAFFRVDLGGTRAEYYVVVVDASAGRIVGLKAKAVES